MERNILEARVAFVLSVLDLKRQVDSSAKRGNYFCDSWFVPKCKSLCGKDDSYTSNIGNTPITKKGIITKLTNPWPESASELYQPSDCRLSAKLVPTLADGGSHVVGLTDPHGRILGFLDRSRYFSIK
jgi:hypothetical protein